MAFLEMYLNGEWKNLSSFGTVSSVDIQSSSSAISVTGSPITSVGIINLSFNPSAIRLDQFAVPTSNLDINNKRIINVSDPVNPQDVATKAFVQASTPTISVTGAVIGTINSQGVINTSLSQYIPISGSFINFNWPDLSSYGSPYSLYNYLPNADPAPIFNISSQTGSGATNSLRRWSMQFSQGSATSIGYEFALSFYHSLIAGDHTVTPFRIVYHVPDQQAWLEIKANLDVFNYKIVNVPNPTASDHAANKGYIDSKTWTSTSITDFATSVTNTAKLISLNQFAVPMASLSMNNYRITNVSDPVNPQDVANKLWVENLIAGGGGGSTINLTGSVIGSGTDTITTSFNRFQTINNVDNTQTWTYNLNVDTGQLVSYHNTILSDTSASIRKFINRIARKSLTDNQFQWEHDIDTTSISDYQSIKMNFVNGYNNPGTFTVFSANLVNNVITASFNSPLSILNGTLSTHAVTKSQLDNKKLNEFGVNNDVDLGGYKLSTSTAPTQGNHVCNKTYVDSNLKGNIRTGQVVVGDVGGTTGVVSLTVSGAILSATKRNGHIAGDSFIDITFADKSYTPFAFLSVNQNTNSASSNDIQVPVVLTITNTTARIYLEENYSTVQNIFLFILLINPNLT